MNAAPTDIKLKRAEGLLVITWTDGDVKRYAARDLRLACRCAGCIHEFTGQPLLDPAAVPDDLSISDVRLVGNYALQLVFTDGHDTGIYTWPRLAQVTTT